MFNKYFRRKGVLTDNLNMFQFPKTFPSKKEMPEIWKE